MLHRRTVEHWRRAVEAVGPDDWERATPCAGWSVRDLVNHVVGEELWTVPLVQGSTIEEVGARFDGDVLGSDPLARSLRAATEAVAVVDERAPAGGTVHLSYGEEQLGEYLLQLCADHLVHGWDLAVAVGADARMAPELVDAVAEWFRDREELYRSAGAIGQHVQTDGDAQTQLLAAFGRDARWAATP